jgi:hypothetical protein
MATDIEDELMQHDTDLTRRAARYIRVKRQTEVGLRAQLQRCREVMECNDPLNARDLFGTHPTQETEVAQSQHPIDQVQTGIYAKGINVPPFCMACNQHLEVEVIVTQEPEEL